MHYVPVDAVGKIELFALTALVSAKTLLVTVAYVNSEIGTIQDLGAISRVIARVNREGGGHTLLHTDAAQAPLWLPCDLVRLGVDLLSLDAGKFCGPKGIGILVRRKGVVLQTITYGGGQEAGLRPGTENVPAVIGFAAALVLAQSDWLVRSTQIAARRDYFIAALTKAVPALVLNGGVTTDRVANNVNISIPGLDSEFAVVVLDIKGVAASTKSACSSAGGGESVVVKTISGDTVRATSTLRFTLGPDTTSAELDRAVLILADHLAATPVR